MVNDYFPLFIVDYPDRLLVSKKSSEEDKKNYEMLREIAKRYHINVVLPGSENHKEYLVDQVILFSPSEMKEIEVKVLKSRNKNEAHNFTLNCSFQENKIFDK